MDNLVIYCPSVRPMYYEELKESVKPTKVIFVDGKLATSFANICNCIIKNSFDKYIIISNDKARPNNYDVLKMLDLFRQGFGFVALYRMGFFGIHRNILGRVGLLDERFVDGGYEDADYYIRLKQNDIASYICEDIDYIVGKPSLWKQKESAKFFNKKYLLDHRNKIIYKLLSDSIFSYKIKSTYKFDCLPWQESFLGTIPFIRYEDRFDLMLKTYTLCIK